MPLFRTSLFLVALFLLISGCSESLVSTNEGHDPAEPESVTFLSKKGDNKGKPPSNDGGSDAFPTWSGVSVSPVSSVEAAGWYSAIAGITSLPGEIARYTGPSGETLSSAQEFFGCPAGDLVAQCYKIVLTYDQAQPDDKAAIRFYPMEEDVRCAGGVCPEDTTLDDGTDMPDRRLLSLFDDYLGTPYVPVSAFDSGTKSFTYFWQGQHLRVSDSGTSAVGYFRFDRDPDDFGADLLRAAGTFVDASNANAGDNVAIMEIDQCASANPMNSGNTSCVFGHDGARPSTADISVEMSGFDVIQGRGRNKSTSIAVTTAYFIQGQLLDNLYVVYLIESNDGTNVTRSVITTGNQTISLPATPGCVSIHPVQGELVARSDSDFAASFSAETNGFNAVFDVSDSGAVSLRPNATSCATL